MRPRGLAWVGCPLLSCAVPRPTAGLRELRGCPCVATPVGHILAHSSLLDSAPLDLSMPPTPHLPSQGFCPFLVHHRPLMYSRSVYYYQSILYGLRRRLHRQPLYAFAPQHTDCLDHFFKLFFRNPCPSSSTVFSLSLQTVIITALLGSVAPRLHLPFAAVPPTLDVESPSRTSNHQLGNYFVLLSIAPMYMPLYTSMYHVSMYPSIRNIVHFAAMRVHV